MTNAPDARAALAGRLIAVLNTGSGSCDDASAGRIAEIFTEAGLAHAEVVSVEPSGIEAALKKAAGEADVVAILGGDGTIRTAAALCGAAGKPLIPLPGGTMNMLPHALYGPRAWPEALADTLADPRVRDISGGRIGDEAFFCAAILGAPSLWADAREALRRFDVVEAVKRSITAIRRSGDPLTYRMDSQPDGSAQAVAVICPLVSKAMDASEPSLEVAAVDPVAAAEIFRLAFHAVFDDWRLDPSVSLAKVKQVEVRGHGRVPAILDGERVRMGRVVTVDFTPLAFRALVPAEARP